MNIFDNNNFKRPAALKKDSSISKFWNPKGIILLALMAVALPGCGLFGGDESKSLGNVTTGEVVDNTKKLAGQTVTIRSEPVEKVGPASFTLSDERLFGNENVLVINATGEKFVLPADDDTDVQVTGTVSNFVLADVEREYNLRLDKQYYVDYENKPAIIAKSMAPAPEPGEITQNPERYYNRRLAVTGEVERIQDANLFTLDEDQLFGGEDLLVLNLNSQNSLKQDETVAVTGVIRPFLVGELERDYDLTWNLQIKEGLEAEYDKKPVLVADGIYPSAIPESKK